MKKLLATLGALVLVVAFGRSASAAPILGGQLYYTGGAVTITSLPVSSGYVSELGLYDGSFNRLLYIMNDEPAGVVASFDPGADFGISIGSELIFGIRILAGHPLNKEYFMGPAGRNADGIMHAAVDSLGGGVFTVGFEDLYGGGDRDFDDNVFRFEGGVQANEVPEPATLSLLALGLIPAALRKRRSR